MTNSLSRVDWFPDDTGRTPCQINLKLSDLVLGIVNCLNYSYPACSCACLHPWPLPETLIQHSPRYNIFQNLTLGTSWG